MTVTHDRPPVMTKAAAAQVKAAGPDNDLGEGEFTALVSVFGNIDTYGDVVMAGAFTDFLTEARAKGNPIPVVWYHDWLDVYSHIGWVDPNNAEETDAGLVVTAQLDINSPVPAAAEKARQVYQLLKGRRIRQFSFAFDVFEAGWGERTTDDGETREVFELRKLGIHEVGPCLVGVNRDTDLQTVKAVHHHFTPPKGQKPTDAPRAGEDTDNSSQAEPGAASEKSPASTQPSPASATEVLIALTIDTLEGDEYA